MVAPLVELIGVSLAGAIGSALVGGLTSKPITKKEMSIRTQETITYSPSYAYSYQPQITYNPQVVLSSPYATLVSKKELSAQTTAEPQVTPVVQYAEKRSEGSEGLDKYLPYLLAGLVVWGVLRK